MRSPSSNTETGGVSLEETWWRSLQAGLQRQANPQNIKAEVYARPRFGEFYRAAWHVVEPARGFRDNWHLDAIAEHLEAVADGQIKQLIITMPPRHMKSLLTSVFFPAWLWTFRPWMRLLWSSYQQKLSTRDSVKTRRLLESKWYRSQWGHVFRLTSDQNEKMRYENDKTGYRIATSVEGGGTGEGGDIVAVDDPHKVLQAESEVERTKVIEWWDTEMSSRLDDQATGAFLVINQRTHPKDLTGHLIAQGGWDELRLPAEFDPGKRSVTSLGWKDPRTKAGELLWQDRFPPDFLAKQKRKLGYKYHAQYQQDPAKREGYRIKRHWFKFGAKAPPLIAVLRAWDLAATDEEENPDADNTAGVKMGLDAEGRTWILHAVQGLWSSGTRDKEIRNWAKTDGYGVTIWGEQEPGSGGKDQAYQFRKNLRGYAAYVQRADHNLERRADPFIAAAEAGFIWLLEDPPDAPAAAKWNEEYLDSVCSFNPDLDNEHDDLLSATALGYGKLNREEDEEDMPLPPTVSSRGQG